MLARAMSPNNVALLEVTPEELGGQEPIVGGEILLGAIRYRILGAKPPKARPWRWKRRTAEDRQPTWQLVVQKVD
jgi:hypothetical protein